MPTLADRQATAARILAARLHAGLSRAQAAERLKISEKTIQRLEEIGTDSRLMIRRLARVYGVSPILLGYSTAELTAFIAEVAAKGLRY